MLEILNTVESWLHQHRKIALATVIETWGSAPRQPGAKMGISETGDMVGSVSGGCVEAAVASEALDILENHQPHPHLLNFGVSDDTAWEVGLACGGKLTVFVEFFDPAWWQILTDHIERDLPIASVVILSGDLAGHKILVDDGGIIYHSPGLSPQQCQLLASWTDLHQHDPSRRKVNNLDVFVEIFHPRPKLFIIGGAHIAIALANYAHSLGFQVILIDPRKAFATPERFPNARIISHDYPDKAFEKLPLTSESYIAVLTHDPKIDDPALKAALESDARYIGVLSSTRSHQKRIERLTTAGINPDLFNRIKTPVGLEIGAKTPEEIAISIIAEIIAIRNDKIPGHN